MANRGVVVKEGLFVFEEETRLTVLKTSLFFHGDGFSVYNTKGKLVFRADSYTPNERDGREHVLMDDSGRCLLTVRRKHRSLHHRWEGFVGDSSEKQKAIFSVRRSSMVRRSSVTVEVMRGDDAAMEEYEIEGSFTQRRCVFVSRETKNCDDVVAEVRRKMDASANVVMGKDVFSLWVKAGFDAAFAMAIVLVLDQLGGSDGVPYLDPIVEDNDDGKIVKARLSRTSSIN